MSQDARGMIEVNLELLRAAAQQAHRQGAAAPLVVSAATWGRGCRQEVLRQLEPYRHAWGYNSSLVAVPPRELAARLLRREELAQAGEAPEGRFQALGMAYGKLYAEWLPLEGEESGPELV